MYIGIMENKMETTIMGCIGYALGFYWSFGVSCEYKSFVGNKGVSSIGITVCRG